MEDTGLKLRSIRTRLSRQSYAAPDQQAGTNGDTKLLKEWPGADDSAWLVHDEPVSPAGRVFLQSSFNAHIIVILGSEVPINVDVLKLGIRNTLLKHKRFRSVIRTNQKGNLHWAPVTVNLDDHIIIAGSDDVNSPTFVEAYAAQLAQAPPLEPSRPLFEFHIVRAKLGDATENVILRAHHVLGDGTSLMSLLLACTRKAEDPQSLPTVPTQRNRIRKKLSTLKAFFLFLWKSLLILWYTLFDVCIFTATTIWLNDSQTPLKGKRGVEKLPRKLAHRDLSMDDIKAIKSVTGGTVSDVVFGMVAAGLSRYLQQRYAEEMNCQGLSSMKMIFEDKHSKKIMKKKRLDYLRVRACIMVNLRKSPGLQELERMMNGGPEVRWGNQMSYSILPVPVAIFDNPLEYVVRSKSIIDKKKVSLGALFAYQSGTMLMNLVGSEMPTRLTLNCSDHTTLAFSSVFGPLEQLVSRRCVCMSRHTWVKPQ
ncbi:hypothetical protein KP509_16G076900 [Ceratopteris richardii]|uniref:Diacylglycerol O-acyltransferase n=1 Tax=Ceratopteris richardii TaxID=49495 RepID=A0A8T2T209_CERRI|nr:hypothetical protein KP509_16G076900 [Ceratopteris richardii]